MNETTYDGDGNVVEQVVDRGDGTGTRTTYGPGGGITAVEELTGLPIAEAPSNLDAALALLGETDPANMARAIAAGALLVSKAGVLWDALLEVAPSNTAKPLLDQIVDVALTAALQQS